MKFYGAACPILLLTYVVPVTPPPVLLCITSLKFLNGLFLFVVCYRCVEGSWNVIAHAQKPDFVFRRNGRVHLNRRGRQFSRLLAAEVCASAVVMLDRPCFEVVWRVLATHSIRQFLLHFPSRASPCAITFQLESINMLCNMNCIILCHYWTVFTDHMSLCVKASFIVPRMARLYHFSRPFESFEHQWVLSKPTGKCRVARLHKTFPFRKEA